MCRCAYPQEIFIPFFFLWITLFLNFEIWRKWKVLLKQLVSTTPLKHLNRIAWNFEVMKDIMCRYAFLKEIMIWSFWGGIYIPFFCPIARHKCLELPFIVYSILKQCWSVGYVSLLTLSFIFITILDMLNWKLRITQIHAPHTMLSVTSSMSELLPIRRKTLFNEYSLTLLHIIFVGGICQSMWQRTNEL